MGILRILLIAIAVLIFCLIVLPKTAKEKALERLSLKIIVIICIALTTLFSVALFYFKDTLWADHDNYDLILRKVQAIERSDIKSLTLSNYDLRNFSTKALSSVLNNNPKIQTLILKNLTLQDTQGIKSILLTNITLKTLVLNNITTEGMIELINSLIHNKSINVLALYKIQLNIELLNALKNILEKNKIISSLILEYIDFNQDSALYVNSIILNSSISKVILRGNQFQDKEIAIITKGLMEIVPKQHYEKSPIIPATSTGY